MASATASVEPVVQKQVLEQPAAPAPSQPSAAQASSEKSDANCSTITDAAHPSSGFCPPQILCGEASTTKDCLANAKWTPQQPYNHGPAMIYRPFHGPTVAIGPNQSLWNVPDEGAGNTEGRKLEARMWNGEGDSKLNDDMDSVDMLKCAPPDTETSRTEFQVSIACEMGRQAQRQSKFERREDGYLDPSQCKGALKWKEGWETPSAQYWKEHQSEPVGVCEILDSQSPVTRVDVHPVREPNWLSPMDCEILRPLAPITLSNRGVRGCRR